MTRTILHATRAGLLALPVLLAACASGPTPRDTFYRLDAGAPAQVLAKPVLPGILEVDRLYSDTLLGGRPVVHRDAATPHQLEEHNYHFWTEPPPLLLREQIIDYLRAAKVADMVVSPEMQQDEAHILTGTVRRMEKVDGDKAMAVLDLELVVRRPRGDKILMLKTYHAERLATGAGVAETVVAFDEALADILARFLADLAGLREY